MIDELYINGQKADISETGISLTYQSTMFSELSKIVSNFSYTIKLPKTDNNIKLIEGAIFPSSASRFPYLVHSGTVLRDGIKIVDKANVVILSVSDEIELSLSWGTSTALSELINDGATLKDLPITDTTIIGSTQLGSEVTPIIDWGAQDDVYNVFNHPVIYAVNIFQKILEKYNVSIHLPSDLSAYINKLMIPLTSQDGVDVNNDVYEKSAYISSDTELIEFDLSIPLFLVENPDTPYYYVEGKKGTDNYISIKGKDKPIEVEVTINSVYVEVNTILSADKFFISFGEEKLYPESYEQIEQYYLRLKFNGTLKATTDSVLNIKVSSSSGDFQYYKVQGGEITIRPNVTYLKKGAVYPFLVNMPDIKITDFIKTIKTMFGLYARVEDGAIYLEKYDSIYDFTKAEDWSERLVYGITGKCDIDFHTDLAQRNTFTYKNDEVINPDYDGVIVINDMSLEQEKEAYKSEFEATHNTTYAGQWCARIPIYSKNEDGEIEYNDVNPRILASAGQLPNNVVGTFDGLPWPKLISKYYQKYIDMMTDAKYVTVDMIITPLDLKEVDLYKPIYLKQYGCYFAITEIKTGDNNICSVTLIKL